MDLADRHVTTTPEGVSLSVVLAGLGSRFGALFIDGLIQGAVFAGLLFGSTSLIGTQSESGALIFAGLVLLVGILDFIGYFILFEMYMSGRTPGKRAFGLRVVKVDGQPVGFFSSLLRNAFRIVDYLPTSYLLGGVLILATTKNQRIGDMVAGTVVVRERQGAVTSASSTPWTDAAQWSSTGAARNGWVPISPYGPGVMPPELAYWDVSAVTPADVTLVNMFLSNRQGYTPEARARIGYDLAGRIWPVVAGAPRDLHAERFLEAVVLVKSLRG